MRVHAFLIALLLTLLLTGTAVAERLAIIVNVDRVVELDLEAIAQIYLKHRRFWAGGDPIVPVNREAGSPSRERFTRRVLRLGRHAARDLLEPPVLPGRTPARDPGFRPGDPAIRRPGSPGDRLCECERRRRLGPRRDVHRLIGLSVPPRCSSSEGRNSNSRAGPRRRCRRRAERSCRTRHARAPNAAHRGAPSPAVVTPRGDCGIRRPSAVRGRLTLRGIGLSRPQGRPRIGHRACIRRGESPLVNDSEEQP